MQQKIKTITEKQATIKVLKMREDTKIDDLSIMLGLSKKTVYKRLKLGKWSLSERLLIEHL